MYPKRNKSWIKHWDFIILDIASMILAFCLGYRIRMGRWFTFDNGTYLNLLLVYVAADFLVILAGNMYRNSIRRGYLVEFGRTIVQIIIVTGIVSGWFFVQKRGAVFSRLMVLYTFLIYLLISYVLRILRKYYLRTHPDRGRKKEPLVVFTLSALAPDVLRDVGMGQYTVSGLILMDTDAAGSTVSSVPVIASKETYREVLTDKWVDGVLIAYPDAAEVPNELINCLVEAGFTVHVKLYNSSRLTGSVRSVGKIGEYTVMTCAIQSLSVWQIAAKRLFDIVIGLIGTAVTGVLYLVLAPLIRRASPGPVIFKQERIGRNGRHFMMYKFRSMVPGADAMKEDLQDENVVESGLMFKMHDDPRIIGSKVLPDGTYVKGIGNFIRDTSLDEFPQFLNVLKGDMSVIGTRPPTVDEWQQYELRYRARMAIKPGITGLWQVSGRSKVTDFDEVMRLDMQYIEDWSPRLDLLIFLRTVRKVLTREGAG